MRFALPRQNTSNEWKTGLLFILPWIIGFLCFFAYPVIYSIYLSFCYFDGMTNPVFIGLGNYTQLFADERFWKSLLNTLYITLLGVPIGLAFSLSLAYLVNQKRKGISIYRTIFYLPCLTPIVAMSILWKWLFDSELGLFNLLISNFNDFLRDMHLGFIQLPRPGWFSDPAWAKPALVIMGLWGAGGVMLIFLAALTDVPKSLYESAEIDGAGWFRKQLNVTLPMISPVIFFNLIMGLIAGFQYFTQAYVMTDGTGGPQDSTLFYALYLFNNAFPNWLMGYASAQAWVLFFITLIFTMVTFKVALKHVYYGGE